MRLDLTPTLNPFDPADRPGAIRGALPTALSPLDLAGVLFKQPKNPDRVPAGAAAATGISAIDEATAADQGSAAGHRARLEHQARQLVGQTFFGTLMKQMRDSPFKSELFDGGRGGQAFNSLYDQRLVEQMSRGAGKKLVDAIVRKLEARQAYNRQVPGTQPTSAAARPGVTAAAAALPAAGVRRADNHSNRNARPDVALPARRA